MNALPILPADIAFVIAEQTRDPSTLAALCLVSSDVITVAGPRLVRSVAFGNHAQVVRYFSPSELVSRNAQTRLATRVWHTQF